MNLIFYEKLALRTAHSPTEIRRRMEAGIGKPRGGGFKALRKPEKPFEGTFDGNKFLFWRAIRHSNGFMPLVTGTIEPGAVHVELKLHPFMRIFIPAWLALLVFLGLTVPRPVNISPCTLALYVPFAIVVFVYGMGIFFYNFYADKAKKFFNEVVN